MRLPSSAAVRRVARERFVDIELCGFPEQRSHLVNEGMLFKFWMALEQETDEAL